ncbi:MAG: hypothetical protein LBM02_08070 [Lachnospiraceae bacterium]|nr:hypothetical protein [Lachnospiraceae bacterium]
MTQESLLESAIGDYDSRHGTVEMHINDELTDKDNLTQADFSNDCKCEEYVQVRKNYSILLPELVNNLINDIKVAKNKADKAKFDVYDKRQELWLDPDLDEKIKSINGASRITEKMREQYVRKETKDLEIIRYKAENEYETLLKIYERL